MPAVRAHLRLLLPGGILALAGAFLFHPAVRQSAVSAALPWLAPTVLGLGLLVAWRFQRSRLLFALLVLLLAEGGRVLLPGAAGSIVWLLLPVNLVLIAAWAERGLFTAWGLLRLGFIGGQAAVVGLLYGRGEIGRLAFWSGWTAKWPLPAWPSLPAPQEIWLTFLAGEILLLLLYLYRRGALEAGFLWALPSAFLPLALGRPEADLTLGLATAGLVLTAAVIEASLLLAYRDELTGLPARRALQENLLKLGRRYTVAMVDVDHFKKVNDRYGHDVGDQVLKMVAARLAETGGGGVPFRYGGEEFTLLFPGRGAAEALPHLERLRQEIQDARFTLRHSSRPSRPPKSAPGRVGTRQLRVTVSIGLAERRGGAGAAEVLKAADQALYRAKNGGRNRVCTAPAGKKRK